MPGLEGIHHVAFCVSDLPASVDWYERVFGGAKVIEEMELAPGHVVTLLACGPLMIGLHRDERCPPEDRFSEFRVGLDHYSFAATNRAEVEAWAQRLDELGIEHSPIADEPPGHILVFRDPDNIQLELMAPAGSEGDLPPDGPVLRGTSHVGLTVRDLDASAEWYRRLLDPAQTVVSMREEDFGVEYLATADGTLVGLHAYPKATPDDDRFDERRCGLDHIGFGCSSRGEVEQWLGRLDELGIDHSGIQDVPYGHVLVFRDPDNIQLEFFAFPS